MGEDWQRIIQRQKAAQEATRRAQQAPRENAEEVQARQDAKAWLAQFKASERLAGIREQVWQEGEIVTVDLISQQADQSTYWDIVPRHRPLYGYALVCSFERALRDRGHWLKQTVRASLGVFLAKDAAHGRLLVVHSVIPAFIDCEERIETWTIDVLDSKDPERELVEALGADCYYRQENGRLPAGLREQGRADLKRMPKRWFGLFGR